jgi:hypothetical protein
LRIAFEPSGTHLKGDSLKIRLDLFPEVGEKSYAQNYVSLPVIPVGGYPGKVNTDGSPVSQKAYDTWLAGLPHIWQLNPCLSVFVRVDQNITPELLTQFVGDVYKPDVLATIDDAMIQASAAHLVSPYCKGKATLSTAKTNTFDAAAKTDINNRLAGLSIVKAAGRTIETIQPKSIDVGPAATDRGNTTGGAYTDINITNPANATGTLDTFEIWLATTNSTNMTVGTFSGSGTQYTSRDSEYIGNVTAGSKQTKTGLSIDVVTGDFNGAYNTQNFEWDTSGNSDVYTKSGNQFGAGEQTFTRMAGDAFSLYATGTEAATDYPITCAAGLTVGASVARTRTIDRAVSGNLSVAASVVRSRTITRATTSNLSVAVSLLKGWGRTKVVNAGLTISAAVVRTRAITRAVTAGLTAAATVAKTVVWNKGVSAGLTIGAVITATGVAVTNYLITVAANLTASASVVRTLAATRTTASNLTVATSLLKGWGRTKAVNAGLTVAAAVTRTRAITRATVTSLTASAVVVRTRAITRATTTRLSVAASIVASTLSTAKDIAWIILCDPWHLTRTIKIRRKSS